MNIQDYKVAVSGKKQAKQFKQALLALGEVIADDYWVDEHDHPQTQLISTHKNQWLVCQTFSRKEITFKELIKILVNEEKEVKPGLLDGDKGIQVNNEREFDLLMKHFEAKGWVWINKKQPMENRAPSEYNYKTTVSYRDGFSYNLADGYKIIPFADFAKETGIKVPAFVSNSADGAPLYLDDIYYGVNDNKRIWEYVLHSTPNGLPFSTREAAEKWIEEQNKPKEVEIFRKSRLLGKVNINGFKFNFEIDNELFSEEIEEIYTAWKSFQP